MVIPNLLLSKLPSYQVEIRTMLGDWENDNSDCLRKSEEYKKFTSINEKNVDTVQKNTFTITIAGSLMEQAQSNESD